MRLDGKVSEVPAKAKQIAIAIGPLLKDSSDIGNVLDKLKSTAAEK